MPADRLDRLPVCRLGGGLRVFAATTPRARLLGLAALDELGTDEALLLAGCRSVHTFGMRFALDLVFLDEHARPIRAVWGLRPRRVATWLPARSVLETPAGGGYAFVRALGSCRPRGIPQRLRGGPGLVIGPPPH